MQGRLQSAATDEGAGQIVPFYFQPTLGGSTSHRGFNDFRFRDDAVVNVNVEYRWEAFSGLDMALFSDWGTVASNIDQLKLSEVSERLRHRLSFQYLQVGVVPHRYRIRRRRRPGVLQVQQGVLVPDMRNRWLVAAVAVAVLSSGVTAIEPKFFRDDPLTRDPEIEDASGVRTAELSELVRLRRELVSRRRRTGRPPCRQHQHGRRGPRLELVHQSRRAASVVDRSAGQRARYWHRPGAGTLDDHLGQDGRRRTGLHDS